MLRYGYDGGLASGVIAASGTLAQLIPPSLGADHNGTSSANSVGDMMRARSSPVDGAALYAIM